MHLTGQLPIHSWVLGCSILSTSTFFFQLLVGPWGFFPEKDFLHHLDTLPDFQLRTIKSSGHGPRLATAYEIATTLVAPSLSHISRKRDYLLWMCAPEMIRLILEWGEPGLTGKRGIKKPRPLSQVVYLSLFHSLKKGCFWVVEYKKLEMKIHDIFKSEYLLFLMEGSHSAMLAGPYLALFSQFHIWFCCPDKLVLAVIRQFVLRKSANSTYHGVLFPRDSILKNLPKCVPLHIIFMQPLQR